METIVKILQFILSFSLLVIIHELGHFMFARMFGIRVEKFYLFFNPGFSLVKFRIGQTEYGIGWIPFGGYVKIAGMFDESLDNEQMAASPKPDEFRSKPAWQRLLVLLGGVMMNVVLAVFIFIGTTWAWGSAYIPNDELKYGWVFNDTAKEIGFRDGDRVLTVGGQEVEDMNMVYPEIVINGAPDVVVLRDGQRVTVSIPTLYIEHMLEEQDFMIPRTPFVIGAVAEDGGAGRAGLVVGDSVVAVDGQRLAYFDLMSAVIRGNAGREVEVTVVRDSSGVAVERTIPVEVSDAGVIGVNPLSIAAFATISRRSYTFAEAIPAGVRRTGTELANYWKQVKMLVKPETKAYKSIGGPISIFRAFPGTWSWPAFWDLTAFLSVILAVMNILPVPGLDGGHVVFTLYELITRRKPSERFLGTAQMIGVLLLFLLIIYATGNDIMRLFR